MALHERSYRVKMNIVKFGGSIVNPNGKYDDQVIQEFMKIAQKSGEGFVFVVGGGKICRLIQGAAKKYLEAAQGDVKLGRDEIGIAVTKINAHYVLGKFLKLGKQVYNEIIIDPTEKPETDCKIFIASGWRPGASTDLDMMLLAKSFKATKVFKISDFEIVKDVKPQKLAKLSDEEAKKELLQASEISTMRWDELKSLVGKEWVPGLHTPFDPAAAQMGKPEVSLFIGRKEEFPKMLAGTEFRGTVVKG
jgi:uridylate kinase